MNRQFENMSEAILLLHFNNREIDAFEYIYSLYYKELFHFTRKLYAQNQCTDAQDTLQDLFAKLWENRKLKFEKLSSLKGFLYISIKNNFRNQITHSKYEAKYRDKLLSLKDDYFVVQIAESETLSTLSHALDLLPQECAKVLCMYIDGWSVKEIAQELNKTESTVYTQKTNAINLLKRKLPNGKLLVILLMLK